MVLFNAAAVKIRVVFYDDYLIGIDNDLRQGYFVHLTVTMLAGRDVEQKSSIKNSLYNCLAGIFTGYNDVHFSVKVLDVEKELYTKSI